jgi:hypothetical protein
VLNRTLDVPERQPEIAVTISFYPEAALYEKGVT